MEFCPKCERLAEYDAYAKRIVCTCCNWQSEKKNIKVEKISDIDLIDYINELHTKLDYPEYSHLHDLASNLIFENEAQKVEIEELKSRLEDRIEVGCKIGDTVYIARDIMQEAPIPFVVHEIFIKKTANEQYIRIENINGVGSLIENIFADYDKAEARLKELKGESKYDRKSEIYKSL